MHVDDTTTAAQRDATSRLAVKGTGRTRSPYANAFPPAGSDEFITWYDSMTPEEFEKLMKRPRAAKKMGSHVRDPGGEHEWLMVAELRRIKRWKDAPSLREIYSARTRTQATAGRWFKHGGKGSGTFHKELQKMIRKSNSYREFKHHLNNWADHNMFPSRTALWPDAPPLGRYSLPEDLQLRGEGG
jgi:hypothetical protein